MLPESAKKLCCLGFADAVAEDEHEEGKQSNTEQGFEAGDGLAEGGGGGELGEADGSEGGEAIVEVVEPSCGTLDAANDAIEDGEEDEAGKGEENGV